MPDENKAITHKKKGEKKKTNECLLTWHMFSQSLHDGGTLIYFAARKFGVCETELC